MRSPITTLQEGLTMSDIKSETSSHGPKHGLRPWYVYLMAVWAFIVSGSLLSPVVQTLAGNNEPAMQIGYILMLGLAIALSVNVFLMKKSFLIVFGCLCALVATWLLGHAVGIFPSRNPGNPVVYMVFYFAPSVVFSVISLRPKFLASAESHRAQQQFEAMKKVALKQIKRKII